MRCDSSLTVGELMANPVTQPIVAEMIKKAQEDSPFGDANEAVGDEMMQAMMRFMPLKSVMSFGMMTETDMEQLLSAISAALGQR